VLGCACCLACARLLVCMFISGVEMAPGFYVLNTTHPQRCLTMWALLAFHVCSAPVWQ
jgi:hypothetical protein